MPMYDRLCVNEHKMIDCWEPINLTDPVPCKECGAETQRHWFAKPAHVVSDEIPGGMEIRHGLCNEDGSPRRYYSHSEIKAEMKKRDLINWVEHAPPPGTDKSKHTSRWV